MATQEAAPEGELGIGTAPEAAAAGYGAEGMPQLDPSIWPNLIFWLVVSIVALYLILTRVALPRIGALLAERQDAIASDLEMAALLKRRAEEAERAYEKALADAREEAMRIAEANRAAMQDELKRLMAKADAEIAAKAAESERRIEEIRAGAAESVEEVARDTAQAILAALMPRIAAEADADAALAAAVRSELGG